MLKNKRVVVIGGSSGIGLAAARRLLADGAQVVIASRNRDKLEAARADLGEPESLSAEVVDITDLESVSAMFGRVGEFTHLVISAAVVPGGRISDTPANSVREAFESRMWGSYSAIRDALPLMSEGASVVLFSGLSAVKPFLGESAGAASCGAIEALVRTLAVEIAPVRINAIRPGVIDTPLLDDYFGESKSEVLDQLGATLPVGRNGNPDDIADVVRFLLGNGFVTGSVLTADGGHSLV